MPTPYRLAGRYHEPWTDTAGNRQPTASVAVYLPGTTTLATLWTNAAKATTAANPVTSAGVGSDLDSLGNLTIYADPGVYDTVTTVDGVAGPTVSIAVPINPEEVAQLAADGTLVAEQMALGDEVITTRHIADGSITPPKLTFVPLTEDDLGRPMGAAGVTAATRYVGATISGPPTTGTFQVGDFILTHDGAQYVCTVAGTPGTWFSTAGSGVGTGPAGGVLAGYYPNPTLAPGTVAESHLDFAVATQQELDDVVSDRAAAIATLKAQIIGANVETTTGYPARPAGFKFIMWVGPTDPGSAMTADDIWLQKDILAPPTPTGLAATPGDTQATLTWNAVTASDLAGYRLYRGGVQVFQGTATTYTNTGLTNGTTYSYAVSSYDTVGNESAVSATVTVTPAALPSAPAAPTATGGNAQATVSWAAPSSDGGSAITNYRITPYIGTTPQTATTTGNVLTYVVTGLTNGTTYTFKVAATNAIGTGPDSPDSNAVTPSATGSVSVVQSSPTQQSTGTSVSATLPAAPQVGNTVFALVGHVDGAGVAASNMNAPSGFTQLYKAAGPGMSTLACAIYYRKILDTDNPADYKTVTFTQSDLGTARQNSIQVIEMRDVATNPAGVTGVAAVAGGTTLTVTATAAISVANSASLALFRIKSGSTSTIDTASWTNGFSLIGTASGWQADGYKSTTNGQTPSTALTWTGANDAMAIIVSVTGV